VDKILVDNGLQVMSGQSLLYLENQDYANGLEVCKADVKKAEAALKLTGENYSRTKTLYEQGALAKKDFDSMEASLRSCEADLASARAAESLADESLKNTAIVSPINGLVANRNVNIGQVVAAGTPVMTVEDISAVYVLVNVDQNDLMNTVKIGATAEVSVETQAKPKLTGVIEYINPVANKASRVFELKIRVDNPDNILKPGVFAHVSIKTGLSEAVLAVPQNALTSNQGLYFVFIADQDIIRRQQVEIGSIIGQLVEVKSGLNPGEKIVISNVNKLKDQDRIHIAN
jgi:RND family efflux transporter MFP subunit